MAAGPNLIGMGAFVAIKLAGYTAAGRYLRHAYGTPGPSSLVFGIARTLLGVAAGVGFASAALGLGVVKSEPLFYVLLAPVRLGEWFLVLWFFHRNTPGARERRWRHAVLGSLWSYLLDVPAAAAMFVVPGGMWVC